MTKETDKIRDRNRVRETKRDRELQYIATWPRKPNEFLVRGKCFLRSKGEENRLVEG